MTKNQTKSEYGTFVNYRSLFKKSLLKIKMQELFQIKGT